MCYLVYFLSQMVNHPSPLIQILTKKCKISLSYWVSYMFLYVFLYFLCFSEAEHGRRALVLYRGLGDSYTKHGRYARGRRTEYPLEEVDALAIQEEEAREPGAAKGNLLGNP